MLPSPNNCVRVLFVLALAGLAGCSSAPTSEPQSQAMTSGPAAPLPQAPAQTPQSVKTPLPPATKGPAAAPAPGPSAAPRAGPYLGAQIGFSRARNAGFQEDNPAAANCFLIVTGTTCGGTLDSAGSSAAFGLSAGYRISPMFRADISYQRRGGYNLSGWDPAGTYFDPPITSDAMIVTGFFDFPHRIGGWFQPYIGLGVGASRNKMDALKWNDPTCCTGMLNGGGSNTSAAWQGTLGAAISLDSIAKGLILDIAYRYTDLGQFKKPAGFDQIGIFNATGTTASASGNLRANEFLFGVRWEY